MLDAIWAWLISPYTAIVQMVEDGGPVVILILLACVTMWTITIERYWYFTRILPVESDKSLKQWQARSNHHSWFSRQIRQAMISRLSSGMTANFQVLRVLVPLCPLLGLLGTVTGMLEVFDAMAVKGSADARTMASGISQAMICTLTGLAVSITGLYPVFYFQTRARVETELLADKFAY
ncbi:MAG: MotA/TolQ/ExbB proton channel family protein [Hydrocarboniphaga effusa]|nr:MotA/TolQ/ExbB proton channel family protein [Hydrocarboniphaga effusa]